MTTRALGVGFLAAEAVGATAWWSLLLTWPASRGPFLASGAPHETLLAFAVPDLTLYVGTAAVAAAGLAARRPWAWPLLAVHAGAAAYAALYCWGLVAATRGDGLLGAVLMTPSLFVPPLLLLGLHPRGAPC